MNIPGFTAEHSLREAHGAFHAGVPADSFALKADITPQLTCQWNGDRLICGEPPFGGGVNFGGDHSFAQCRSRCYRTKRGAALARCLADC